MKNLVPRTKRENELWNAAYRTGRNQGQKEGREALASELRYLLGTPSRGEVKDLAGADDYY